jgi:ribosomal protein S18 acetylase RimI-like enzyme
MKPARKIPATTVTVGIVRPARLDDIPALERIENRCFTSDRLTRRSFRHLLTKGNAETLIEEWSGVPRGYVMLTFHEGTSLARLYSLAVDPDFQRYGLATELVRAAEQIARDNDCVYLRLEIRKDNPASIGLFKKHGYKQFGVHPDYYEDHMDALRFEKLLAPQPNLDMVRVPFYQQTLDFTCGPAALMMAMKVLDPNVALDRKMELRIWRESTTIFMTSGHGGCGPYGLALSAYHRGFDVEIYVNDDSALFVDSVRDPEKKEVMRLAQEDFLDELQHLPIKVQYGALKVAEIQAKFEDGGIPIVLISSYRIYREKFPHWVVVTGFDAKYIYVHDPFVDVELHKVVSDCINMPILKKDFERMARYGKAAQKAVIILKNRATGADAGTAAQNTG